ncbi:hypothetical protein AV650_22295 [Serratia fonticola]|nr:hypothetical protein AV650_22295 [Serratia fonticola]
MTDKLEALKAKKPADTKTLAAEKAGYVTDDNSGGYYVVECQECGEIYPSQECDGGGQIADSGDYNDALCPHCGYESPDECSDTPLVWNVQQAKINALLAALEEKDKTLALVREQRDNELRTNTELEQRLQQPIKLPELDSDLIDILGRPNFACIRIAKRLRELGYEIKRRSENEQAATLHFLLSHYLADGGNWRDTAEIALRGNADKVEGE